MTADLHYKKGPYYADEGDFATARTARISVANAATTAVTLGNGGDGYRRVLLLGSAGVAGGSLLGAGEVYRNGPFDVADNYRRLNAMVRYHRGDDRDYFTLTAMSYSGPTSRG